MDLDTNGTKVSMKQAQLLAFLAFCVVIFQTSKVHASFFDSLKKSVEDVANTVDDVVDQTQEAIESIPGSSSDEAEADPKSESQAESESSSEPKSANIPTSTSSGAENSSTKPKRTTPNGKPEWRTHKDDFFNHCMSKRNNEGYCQCLKPAVEATVAKRKARLEKMIEGEDKKPKQAMKLLLTKRLAKDESEILADCVVMRAHENKEISDQEFDNTFTGQKRKNGFYEGRLRKRICFDSDNKKRDMALYNSKDYEFVNPGSIMAGGNQCSREHLK